MIRLNRTPEERKLFGGFFYLPKPRRLVSLGNLVEERVGKMRYFCY